MMMNPSNTINLASRFLTGLPSGMAYWQFLARLNEKFFNAPAKAAADADAPPKPCCELGKMDIDLLIRKYQQTLEATYMGEIYKRYAHLVMGTCFKYLKDHTRAEDAVSEIFGKLIDKLKTSFPENFAGWLYKVTKNHCLEILRKDKTRPWFEPFVSSAELEALPEPEVADYQLREVAATELGRALKLLAAGQRTSIELFYLQGLSYKQVAEKTGFTLKEVKSYVQNGKRNLRILLGPVAGEHGWKQSV
jgi:RNA polymerase sigma-70 factor (ECF subfamily)